MNEGHLYILCGAIIVTAKEIGIKICGIMFIVCGFLLAHYDAFGETNLISTAPKIVNNHVCPIAPLDQECIYRYTQAAWPDETVRQVKQAIKNARFGCHKTFYSLDPVYRGDVYDNSKGEKWHWYNSMGEWNYGAYYCKGKIYVSIMGGCPNIMRLLEKLLRDMKLGRAVESCPRKTKHQQSLYDYLACPECFPPYWEVPGDLDKK